MTDPLNDPLSIWFISNMPTPAPKHLKYHAGKIVIESEIYAKRVAAEFMLGLSTGLTYSGVSFQSTPKSFLIIWEEPLPKKTKNSLETVFLHLGNIFQSYKAKTYATFIVTI